MSSTVTSISEMATSVHVKDVLSVQLNAEVSLILSSISTIILPSSSSASWRSMTCKAIWGNSLLWIREWPRQRRGWSREKKDINKTAGRFSSYPIMLGMTSWRRCTQLSRKLKICILLMKPSTNWKHFSFLWQPNLSRRRRKDFKAKSTSWRKSKKSLKGTFLIQFSMNSNKVRHL